MADRKTGGKQAAETNRARHGADFYQRIARMADHSDAVGGFNSAKVGKDGMTGQQRAVFWGRIGGKKSRGNTKNSEFVRVGKRRGYYARREETAVKNLTASNQFAVSCYRRKLRGGTTMTKQDGGNTQTADPNAPVQNPDQGQDQSER